MRKYSNNYYINNGQSGDRLALGMYFRIFKRYVKPGGRVLEFGAGNGYLSKRISGVYDSNAIELSKYARKNIARISPNTNIIESENFIVPKAYDGIISLHTFEHLDIPRDTIKKLLAGLKKGGILLIVMPDPEGLGHKLKGDSWFAYKDSTHVSILNKSVWVQILNENGMKVIKSGSDWFWDPPYIPLLPKLIQKLLFYPGCLLMVILGRVIYPEKWGEDMILVSRKN